MEDLIIIATKHTPQIELIIAENKLSISGQSWPENAMITFQPLMDKLESYFAEPNKTLKIAINLDFINTCSTKMLINIFSQFQQWYEQDHKIELTWYYQTGDDDYKDNGEMLLEDASFPYTIVELKE